MNRTASLLALSLFAVLPSCKKGESPSMSPGDGASSARASGAAPAGALGLASEAGGDGADAMEGEAPLRLITDAKDAEADYDRDIQAGLLTAGSFDDTLNGATFAAFMRGMSAWSPDLNPFTGPMSVVRVLDERGRAMPGVAVRVRGEGSRGKRLVTGTDGRVVLFAGLDGQGGQGGLEVRLDAGQGSWRSIEPGGRITLEASGRPEKIAALDIALVIDATGSMGDELEYLKVELRSIAKSVSRAYPGVDQRYALVMYRDHGDDYVTRKFDFTHDLSRFEHQLGRQRADGGGDYPEAMDAALADAAELSWRDAAGTARIAFVVADAPPHDQDVAATLRASEQLRAQGVGIYPVAASGVASEAEAVMRASAAASGGQYLFLTDDSGIGNSHEEPHIPCYAVEPLRDAMTRMVHTELSGGHIEADPQRAVRMVGRSRGGVCEALQVAG